MGLIWIETPASGGFFWCGSGLATTSVSMVLGLRANFLVLGLLSAYW